MILVLPSFKLISLGYLEITEAVIIPIVLYAKLTVL